MKTMSPLIFLLVSAVGLGTIVVQGASICPPADSIAPCTCFIMDDKVAVSCLGNEVTETTLSNTFLQLRQVNEVTGPEDWLEMREFSIKDTNITTLDLTPFIRTRSIYWGSWWAKWMTSIVGPALPENAGLIEVEDIAFLDCHLTDEIVKDFLKYFSPDLVTSINLNHNQLNGSATSSIGDGSGDVEFMGGMASLANLRSLDFFSNDLKTIGGGQFKRNTRLIKLNLDYNQIEEIGEDAFLFDEPPEDMADKHFVINLSLNNLHQDKIHDNSGLDGVQRSISLYMDSNQLTSLPVQKFQPFLDANPYNSLYIDDNQIQCDGRVKWLKDRREEYERRVNFANCVNDPGYTVFTSRLVDL